ncbi:FAD-dependent monooxygenase [Streptomyces sp. NPDC020192]|uniref:FAD-dependent monooxygenase n=1 Tax=Streptomyces sp. NPDC020192 TaxID=3365066 RepID=UPI00379F27D3
MHRWYRETGNVSVLPLTDGLYRVFGTEAADTGLTAEQVRERRARPLPLAELRATLRRITGTDCGVRAAAWISQATDSTRHADRYRSGRVLLAGDAAHIHLPAGGQGLNAGLQDATNLAWKLAAEHHGWAPDALVDGVSDYDRERRPVSALLAANALAQGPLMNTFTPAGEALRALFSDLIARGGAVQQVLEGVEDLVEGESVVSAFGASRCSVRNA